MKMGRKLGERQNGLDHIIPSHPRTATTPFPFLSTAFSPPPLTLPVSQRFGSSSVNLSRNPQIQASETERTNSGALSELTSESGNTGMSGTTGSYVTSSQAQSALAGSKELKEGSDGEERSDGLPPLPSPPAEQVEPEAPDPFLVDDSDDPLSDEDLGASVILPPADGLSVVEPTTPTTPVTPLTPNVNKDVPPPPPPESGDDSDEAPDLYLPGLVIPTMFLPIPNVRRFSLLTWWLSSKHVSMYYNHPSDRLIH